MDLNLANYIGEGVGVVEPALREKWHGVVVVIRPGENDDDQVRSERLKVFLDDQGIVNKIVNG